MNIMRELLKFSGVIVIFIAVTLLALYVFLGWTSNSVLVLSAALVVVGFLSYIIINKIVI